MSCSCVFVMRHPVLQEDEGRAFVVDKFTTRAEAEKWIAMQEGQYFSPSDYFILGPI